MATHQLLAARRWNLDDGCPQMCCRCGKTRLPDLTLLVGKFSPAGQYFGSTLWFLCETCAPITAKSDTKVAAALGAAQPINPNPSKSQEAK
jgi:hypothetical protein